jgi:hypothetical protein
MGSTSTLCIDGQFQGIQGGICVAQSQPENGYCAQLRGLNAQERERYVGQSGAAPITQSVCVPDSNPTPPAPQPPLDFGIPSSPLDYDLPDFPDFGLDQDITPPPSSNQGLCSDPTLLLSDHNDPCSSARENQWRCACSRRFETEISQVCRNEVWVTYDTNPVDCAQCSGAYSSACEPSN